MRLNNKGQVLVLFIILIPVFLVLGAFIIDIGLISRENNHLENVSRMVIKEVIDEDDKKEKIEKLMVKNKIDITNLEVQIEDNEIRIKNEIAIKSIFGNIVGIDKYKIKIDIRGFRENDKIMIE